jgi:hypothetical protein
MRLDGKPRVDLIRGQAGVIARKTSPPSLQSKVWRFQARGDSLQGSGPIDAEVGIVSFFQ